MALINHEIPPQNFEIIRDRIAEIAADEMANQAALYYDEDLIIHGGVYVERVWPMTFTERVLINVLVKGGRYDNQDPEMADGNYVYVLDTYVARKSKPGINESDPDLPGDQLARLQMEKIYGKLRYIFSHPIYNNLGYAPPLICNVHVQELLVKPGSEGDADNVMTCRLHLSVRVPETVDLLTARLLDGYQTQVRLNETEFGYQFSSS